MVDKKKKILFLEQYAKLTGGQRVLLGIISGLDKNSYKVSVVLPGQGELADKLEVQKIEYMILPMGYYTITQKTCFDIVNYLFRVPLLVCQLLKIIKNGKIDLVYANGARTFVWGTLACTLAKTPLIWHLHSIFKKGLTKNLCLFFGGWSAVKKIVAVSEAVKKPLSRLNHKIEVVYNGVDTQIFYPDKAEKKLKREFNCSEAETLVATVGLLEEWKNQEDLIRAAGLISNRQASQTKFLIIGESLYDDKKGRIYKEKLVSLVKKQGLKDKVAFTGYRADIPQTMRALDILVLTSKDPDPCPLVLLEGMASGLAVIATHFGGPAEIIEDYRDGLLYTPGNYRELADKIIHLLENDSKRLEMGQRAAAKIRQRFTQREYIKRINQIISLCAQ